MLESLLRYQFLLLVPLYRAHDGLPELNGI